MAENKLLVVIGVTGNQGKSVAKLFSQTPGWRVRGITRNVTSPKALELSKSGIEVVYGDLDIRPSLSVCFNDAFAIFSTTDFWEAFYSPATQNLLAEGQALGEYCAEKEERQGKNIADVAAKVEGLERIIVSSLPSASEVSAGKYKSVYHWDGKARAVKYLRETYPELSEKMSVVIVGNYMENWKGSLKLRKHEGAYRLALVGSGLNRLPHINVEKDMGTIVRAAIESPPGKTILAAGSMLSWAGQLEIWCKTIRIPLGGFDELSIEQFEMFLPISGLGRELGEMMAFMDEFGYTGDVSDVVMPHDLSVPCAVTTWEDYVKGEGWSGILEA